MVVVGAAHGICESTSTCTAQVGAGEGCVTIMDTVTSVVPFAFHFCTAMTAVTIPDTILTIGSSAFNGCSSLTTVSIPDSVTSVGGKRFVPIVFIHENNSPR